LKVGRPNPETQLHPPPSIGAAHAPRLIHATGTPYHDISVARPGGPGAGCVPARVCGGRAGGRISHRVLWVRDLFDAYLAWCARCGLAAYWEQLRSERMAVPGRLRIRAPVRPDTGGHV